MQEVNRFIRGLLEEGFIFQKEVKKCTPTSGAIYLPKELVGKKFHVILTPIKPIVDTFESRISDIETNIKVMIKMIEIVSGKKVRTLLESNKEEVQEIRKQVEEEKIEEIEIKENEKEIKIEDIELKEKSEIKIDLNEKE